MVVTVHLHTVLQRQTPGGRVGRLDVTLPAASSLSDLLRQVELLDLDPESVLMVVNGRSAELSQLLAEGDQVHLIPAMSGG